MFLLTPTCGATEMTNVLDLPTYCIRNEVRNFSTSSPSLIERVNLVVTLYTGIREVPGSITNHPEFLLVQTDPSCECKDATFTPTTTASFHVLTQSPFGSIYPSHSTLKANKTSSTFGKISSEVSFCLLLLTLAVTRHSSRAV
jgi:hypothetical protein